MRENCAAFQRLALHYVLRGADRSDTTVSVLGHTLRAPIPVPPLAFQYMAHPEGELAPARAAGAAGSIYVLATLSTTSVESVVAAIKHLGSGSSTRARDVRQAARRA